MINAYHRDIMEILLSCGKEGMKLCRIASKVYNMHASLFNRDLDYEALRRSIGIYLWRQANHLSGETHTASIPSSPILPCNWTSSGTCLSQRRNLRLNRRRTSAAMSCSWNSGLNTNLYYCCMSSASSSEVHRPAYWN